MREVEGKTYLQCCNCGKVYSVERKYQESDLYVHNYCPCCGENKAINLGTERDDIYKYMDTTLDSRYFIY